MNRNALMVLGLLALGASGCGQQPADPGAAAAPTAGGGGSSAAVEPAPGGGQALQVGEAWSRGVPPNAPVAAGYLSLANGSATDERLLEVRMEAAERVEIHEMIHGGDGTMQMRELTGGLALPAGQVVDLRPGGLHLMFFGPDTAQWQAGGSVPATLVFEQAGEREVSFEVYAPGEGPPAATDPAAHQAHGNGHDGHDDGHDPEHQDGHEGHH